MNNLEQIRLEGLNANDIDAESDSSDDGRYDEVGVLEWYDIFSLIVNSLVGTGIFTAPSTVLVLTGSKSVAMGLWVVGFVYTVFSMFLYLEYSTVLPHTGGELVFLDEMTSKRDSTQDSDAVGVLRVGTNETMPAVAPPRRPSVIQVLLGNGLLAYICYAMVFVGTFNSATNALQVGRQILIARDPTNSNPERDAVRLIGVVALSILCLMHYFYARLGRRLNVTVAVLKIVFLIILLGGGAWSARNKRFGAPTFSECSPAHRPIGYAKAFLLVIFSYEGWENANFVAGEIKARNQTALRTGFATAIIVVGALYILINAVFLLAIPYTPIALNFAPMFFGDSEPVIRWWAIFIAISAAGSMNSIIYTFSRIKQAIGSANILPWSRFWKSDCPQHANDESDRYKTPRGGLTLHWIMSVVLISASASIKDLLESISMPGLLQTYAHCFVLVFVSIGIFWLPGREQSLIGTNDHPKQRSFFRILHTKGVWKLIAGVLVVLYALVNLMLLIVAPQRPYNDTDGVFPFPGWRLSNGNKTLTCDRTDGTPATITASYPFDAEKNDALKGWILPTVTLALFILGITYYLGFFAGPLISPRYFSLFKLAGASCNISKVSRYQKSLEETRRFGRRRTIEILPQGLNMWQNTLFWVFGGELHTTPWTVFTAWWTQDSWLAKLIRWIWRR